MLGIVAEPLDRKALGMPGRVTGRGGITASIFRSANSA